VNYFLLFVVYGAILLYLHGIREFFDSLIWKAKFFIPLALFDVEANYLVVKAYQYTTITSVMLLDSFTIPCVSLLTYFFLNTKYNLRHLAGILFCLAGNVVAVYADVRSSTSTNPVIGDILCICGAIFYSFSNVGAEKYLKEVSQIEYLTFLGFWGTLISIVQIMILERDELFNLSLTWASGGLLSAFSACMILLYSIVPMTLTLGGSTMYNLSLLTSDIYAIVSSILIFGHFPNDLFYVSLVCVVGGLLIYSLKNEVIFDAESEVTIVVVESREETEPLETLDEALQEEDLKLLKSNTGNVESFVIQSNNSQ
jgi:solute carrier family 35 protein F1/2